jgi:predicted metal-dependent HD superfamily phosphohydrolase
VDAPIELPEDLLIELRTAYADPPRAYHHFGHVEDVIARWREVAAGPGWRQPIETFLAVLWHDAIYRAGAPDNEARSAVMAREACARWLVGVDVERVEALIVLTRAHGTLDASSVDDDATHFLDCDMAILGASAEDFDRYDAAIAEEYAAIPRELYRAGRAAFLQRLLASPAIYLSPFFRARLEAPARENIRRALTST